MRKTQILISALLFSFTLFVGTTFGEVITKKIEVDSFHSFRIGGSAKVILTQGSQNELKIESDEDNFNQLEIKVKDEELVIKYESSSWFNFGAEEYTVYLTMKDIKSIRLSGAVDLQSTNEVKAPKLTIRSSGSSSGKVHLDVNELKVKLSGSSEYEFSGEAENVEIKLSGSALIEGLELKSKEMRIKSSGSSSAQVYVEELFTIKTSGSSTVEYRGQPRMEMKTSGSSSIQAVQ